MATWHQSRNPSALAALWKPEPGKFKCITDKPGQPASCMTFDNLEAAKRYSENTGDTLICPPEQTCDHEVEARAADGGCISMSQPVIYVCAKCGAKDPE